ncbi:MULTISPECIES: outer membrane beta-barrel protein [Persicobacter]|uniref:Outer membrane protein beta-barrel domain-containing protein n=1 Tax=Persicobacter diffluens TaxID=981 RepID=A0AAN5AIP0_9BACT|nr:outer membrane beta-barrel protein [Persicobacter sp. CCB-QB2]GJM60084.1 hypothetical protein PEDI_06360 [Persicobacter diffluens]
MTNKIALFVSLLFFSFSAQARGWKFQDTFSNIGLESQLGLNYSSMSGVGQEGGSGLMGFRFGSMFVMPLTHEVHSKVGLFYSQNGASFKGEEGEFDLNIHYLQLPIWGKVSINQKNLNMIGGPQFGLLMHASEIEDGKKRNVTSLLNPLDISANIGLEYELRPNFIISSYYTIGLTDVTGNRENIKALLNSAVTFTMGYYFKL